MGVDGPLNPRLYRSLPDTRSSTGHPGVELRDWDRTTRVGETFSGLEVKRGFSWSDRRVPERLYNRHDDVHKRDPPPPSLILSVLSGGLPPGHTPHTSLRGPYTLPQSSHSAGGESLGPEGVSAVHDWRKVDEMVLSLLRGSTALPVSTSRVDVPTLRVLCGR